MNRALIRTIIKNKYISRVKDRLHEILIKESSKINTYGHTIPKLEESIFMKRS